MSQTFTGLKLKGELGRFGKTEICDVLGVYPMPDEKVSNNFLTIRVSLTTINCAGRLVQATHIKEKPKSVFSCEQFLKYFIRDH